MSESSDTHFITNKDGVTLEKRIKDILAHDTEFLKIIVGYFYSTGFYKIYKDLENLSKMKILVGMGVDVTVTNSLFHQQELIEKVKLAYSNNIEDEYRNVEETRDIVIGVNKMIEFINNKKLEIRAYPSKLLHAKVYIFLKKEGAEDIGKVITGSSNLTQGGLEENLEFNIELKDSPDVKFANDKFEELWKESIPVSDDFVNIVRTKTFLNKEITPYEIYLKTLYEYFKDAVDYDRNAIAVPANYKKYSYQTEAVLMMKQKLEAYGGVFLSDVVGLGKTYITSILAKETNVKPLVISPPRLIDYWDNTMKNFGVIAKVWSSGNLENLLDYKDYDVVIVDEAHDFRNSNTKRYGYLHEICAGKKVILVSATPMNNTPQDIANQIYLFQNKYNSSIQGVKNLNGFFNNLQKRYQEVRASYHNNLVVPESIKEDIQNISKEIREKVLKQIMIRRTRADIIDNYDDDIKKSGLVFSKAEGPFPLYYKLTDKVNSLFDKTVKIIESPRDKKSSEKLFYARYSPLSYLKDTQISSFVKMFKIERAEFDFLTMSERQLIGLLRTQLLKRLDSSFYSFRKTLGNIIHGYELYRDLYYKGTILITKDLDLIEEFLSLADNEDVEEFLQKNNDVMIVPANMFEHRLVENLEKDLLQFKNLKAEWDLVKDDPKIEEISKYLTEDKILSKEKVIIFTEFEDTVSYLKDNLALICPSIKDTYITITGKSNSKDIDMMLRNFDPNYMENKQENKYRIVISTDVLSEGLNLNRASAVINYDIPWNPTRVIQRYGRVNRVGYSNTIYLYNFFPTEKTEDKIHLLNTAKSKIEMFVNALGADARYITPLDTSNPRGVAEKIFSSEIYTQEEDKDEELAYLKEIRNIRDDNPELFKRIKEDIPLKARTTRLSEKDEVVTYFRNGMLSEFYSSGESYTERLDSIEAFKILKAGKDEKPLDFKDFYWDLFKKNQQKFREDQRKAKEMDASIKRGGNEAKLFAIAKGLRDAIENKEEISISLKEYIRKLVLALSLGSISKYRIKDALNDYEKDVKKNGFNEQKLILVLAGKISQTYIENSIKRFKEEKKKEVILSEILTAKEK